MNKKININKLNFLLLTDTEKPYIINKIIYTDFTQKEYEQLKTNYMNRADDGKQEIFTNIFKNYRFCEHKDSDFSWWLYRINDYFTKYTTYGMASFKLVHNTAVEQINGNYYINN